MAAKYIKLASILREELSHHIGQGLYKLPTEAQLSHDYQVSRQTVRQALSLLMQDGLIEKRQGSGTYATGLIADPEQNHIAIIVNYANEYIYPTLLADIQKYFTQQGYSTYIYETEGLHEKEREILYGLITSPVRGILVEGTKSALYNPNLELYRRLQAMGTSLLFFHNNYPDTSQFTYMKPDDYTNSYQLTRQLIAHGHQQIAGIFHRDDYSGLLRYQGWLNAISDCNLPYPDSLTFWYTNRQLRQLRSHQNVTFLQEDILQIASKTSAVVCYNDEIAYWLIKVLQAASINVPSQIAVTSFDCSYLSELSDIRISSMAFSQPVYGVSLAKGLIQMMQGHDVASQELPMTLMLRDSYRE